MDTVSITFEFQKNHQKYVTVSQPRSRKEICPVIIWEKMVQRILEYPKSSTNSPVNTIIVGKTKHYVTDKEMFKHLGNTVDNMTGVVFTGKQVGTHSICSILAMALYLARRLIPTIMLLGR